MRYISLSVVLLAMLTLISCGKKGGEQPTDNNPDGDKTEKVVRIFSHRHYDSDKKLYAEFEKQTGIKVEVTSAKADELIQRMLTEGESCTADLLITSDAARLYRAQEKGLLQTFTSDKINANVPAKFRDPSNFWIGLTSRARVIAYSKSKVDPTTLSTYADLTSPKWKGKILVRSSQNIYNQSLLSSIIANEGEEAAKKWAEGIVNNMAREPKGNDRDQVKAIAKGEGEIAIVNTYYIGKLYNDKDENVVAMMDDIGVFFPNQGDRGTHLNISGAGLSKYAPNKDNAILLLEFLTDRYAQEMFAGANYEYPVNQNPDIPLAKEVQVWGENKFDELSLDQLGANNTKAVMIFDQVGWK